MERTIRPIELNNFLTEVYSAKGLSQEDAAICAWHTTLAQRWRVHTHGINLLNWYLESIDRGGINVTPSITCNTKGQGVCLIDADRAHGQVSTYRAADNVIELMNAGHPIVFVGVVNSNHFGMAGAASYKIAQAGYIGILISSTPPIIAAPGAVEKCVGSNPIAIGFPRGDKSREPINFDTSFMVNAMNRIKTSLADGDLIPGSSYLDRDGEFTTSEDEISKFRLAAPIGGKVETGGYKGYGLAFMFELISAGILGGLTSNQLFSWDRNTQGVASESHALIGIKPDLFSGMDEIETSLRALMSFTKTRERSANTDEILVPGEDRYRNMIQSRKDNRLTIKLWEYSILKELSIQYDIPLARCDEKQ